MLSIIAPAVAVATTGSSIETMLQQSASASGSAIGFVPVDPVAASTIAPAVSVATSDSSIRPILEQSATPSER